MKYMALFATVLSLVGVALVMVIGIRLDVMLAELIGLYTGTLAVMLLVFVFSLLVLVRIMKDQNDSDVEKNGTSPRI